MSPSSSSARLPTPASTFFFSDETTTDTTIISDHPNHDSGTDSKGFAHTISNRHHLLNRCSSNPYDSHMRPVTISLERMRATPYRIYPKTKSMIVGDIVGGGDDHRRRRWWLAAVVSPEKKEEDA